MSKKFIVRLRKGGVEGNIVANSQIITIDPLTGDKIFPSNFTDLRLQGKLATTNRVSNFIKTIIPKPTTTTTTTSTTTTTTTTTTTRAPGTSALPVDGTTTTTTTARTTTQWGLALNPNSINAGGKFSATITKPVGMVSKLYLGILKRSGSDINSTSQRPASQDFVETGWKDSTQFVYNDITFFVNGQQDKTSVILTDIQLNSPLSWLIKDITLWVYISPTLDFGKDHFARTQLTIQYKVSPFSIDILNKTYTKATQPMVSNRVEVNPGDTMEVKIYGLTAGESYALAMEHSYGSSEKSYKFDKNWFTVTYDNFTNNYSEWTSGGFFTNDRYPSPFRRSGTFDSLVYYYMPFVATATTHVVEIPVSSVDYIKRFLYTVNNQALDSYNFSFYLSTFDGKNHYNLNSAIKDSDGTSRYNSVVIRSKYPLFVLRKDESIERIAEGSNEKAIFYLKANRDLRPSELPYKLILVFYKFQLATPIYSDVYSSTSFTVTMEGATGTFDAAYGNANFVLVLNTSVPLTTERKIEIKANTLPGTGPDVVALRVIAFPTSLESSINKPQWLTGAENRDVYDSGSFSVVDPGTAASAKPVAVSNEVFDRLRDEGGSQQEFNFEIYSANWETLSNGSDDSKIIINGLEHYKNPVNSPRGTTLLAYNTGEIGFVTGFPVTYDTFVNTYETEINAKLNSIASGNFLVMYSKDAFSLLQSTRDILNNKFGGTSSFIQETTGVPSVARYGWIFAGYANVRTAPTKELLGQRQVNAVVKLDYTAVVNNTAKNEFKYTADLTATASTTVYWRLEGTGITTSDFVGPTNGNFTVNGTTKCTVLATIKADTTTEGDEEFSVKLYTSDAPGSLPFHNSPTVTITDTSKGSASTIIVSETVTIEPKDVYWRDEPVSFRISGGAGRSKVKISAPNAGELQTETLDANGSWTGPVELYGEATGTPITVTFRFANGVVKEVPVTLIYRAGGSSGCPDPETPINISLTETVRAGDLKPGDTIYTMNEQTLEYGYYTVLQADLDQQPKLLLEFDNRATITVSNSHKFLLESGEFASIRDLRSGARLKTLTGIAVLEKLTKLGRGDVIRFEIDQAHTYLAAGFVSHNTSRKM